MDKLIHQGVGLVDYQGDLISALVSGVSDQHQQQEANSTSWGNCWIGWDWLDKWVQLIFFEVEHVGFLISEAARPSQGDRPTYYYTQINGILD